MYMYEATYSYVKLSFNEQTVSTYALGRIVYTWEAKMRFKSLVKKVKFSFFYCKLIWYCEFAQF